MNMKQCGACGGRGFTAFTHESLPLYDGTLIPGLSGERCIHCGEIHLDDASTDRYVEAGNAAVMAERRDEREWLRRVRRKLKLTQHQAARLTGGGHNAIGRYERGEVQPMPAVINLFKLLDAHPDLLNELQGAEPAH